MRQKGFTLIELLIVIGVIAVLSTVVILVLNPAELLREARDSERISNLATLKSALSFYFLDSASSHYSSNCSIAIGQSCTTLATSTYDFPSPTGTWKIATGAFFSTSSRSINGSGWIDVNFASITGGSPIAEEPLDPVNQVGTCAGPWNTVSLSDCGLYYLYTTNNTSYEIAAFLESQKYSHGGSRDAETNDGGQEPYIYEVGNSNIGLL